MANTPMMQQYNSIKEKYKDSILFFRLGDFYEMFEEDALEVSELLDLTLTKRHDIPMCGVPYHSALPYIKKLLDLGKKIAICEQVSSEKGSDNIVEREVKEIFTPGMILEDELLESHSHNFLLLAHVWHSKLQIAYVDYSTGFLGVSHSSHDGSFDFLYREILRLSPQEVLLEESLYDNLALKESISSSAKRVSSLPEWYFDSNRATQKVLSHFKVSHLKALGFKEEEFYHLPLGILLQYLSENLGSTEHLTRLEIFSNGTKLFMDESTIRNLELTQNLREGSKSYSLLGILDSTKTPMGGRLLKEWILSPSCNLKEITRRQEAVKSFHSRSSLLKDIRFDLSGIKDLERLAIRLSLDRAHARDILYIAYTLEKAVYIQKKIFQEKIIELPYLSPEEAKELGEIYTLIIEAIHKEPATTFNVGNLIAPFYSKELDELKELEINGKDKLQEYLLEEKRLTGMNGLKIKYNKMIGYHFEVPKSQTDLAPSYFIKRQTFMSGDRYTTEKLSSLEQLVMTAGEKALALEKELFFTFRDSLKTYSAFLLKVSQIISFWDLYSNLAYVAIQQNFSCPVLKEMGSGIHIEQGRHPVVEYYLSDNFVANNLILNREKGYFSFIMGPNMAGKSTYLRQVAIIVLLSQIGSFVPAKSAQIGIVDKIFCRVGASDNLARGESTFLVEMNETSFILRKATQNSLVILDEVGRGTSTFDGLAIAWSVSEYLLNDIKSFTIFATHYHELSQIKDPRIQNLSLSVKIKGDDIIFLRSIEEKASLASYGIPVAKLAGLPEKVLKRAKNLLSYLEETKRIEVGDVPVLVEEEVNYEVEEILKALRGVDINKLTPLEALSILSRWKDEWGKK